MTSSRLLGCLGTTEEMAAVFSDAAVLAALLRFETSLARAQARLGVIPASAAAAIEQASEATEFDPAQIAREARASATVALPLVKALTARVAALDEAASRFVHWGATSQDAIDTAMSLLLQQARPVLERDHRRLEETLRRLSKEHAGTAMIGRTLLQPAVPITFGYKAAAWYGAVHRSWRRLSHSFEGAAILQFGGAAGTLASYGVQGPALAAELGKELDLAVPAAPWHAQRDRTAALAANCGIYTAVLGKIARDVSLLMQQEVGEAAEVGGQSSAMPHKRNPAGSVVALAAATRTPGLVASVLSSMVQEHERAAGGWQAEWPIIADVLQTTSSAVAATAEALEGLTVYPERMRANLKAYSDFAEDDLGAAEQFRNSLLEE
jgi:3-carboxy-cis,cis-muconate cycloisomerase